VPTGPTAPTPPGGGGGGGGRGGRGSLDDSGIPDNEEEGLPGDGGNPVFSALSGAALLAPHSSAAGPGGPGGIGTRRVDARVMLGRLSGRNPWTRQPEDVPGVVERIGGAARERAALYSIWHPLSEGYAAITFRPQLTVKGYPNFERNPQLPLEVIVRDEWVRPQVVTLRAFGAQSAATGDFSYVERPLVSRARGGSANGGVMFSPPRFELDDYYGATGGANVDDVTSARATQGYVLVAPGVAFALGKPTSVGGLSTNSTVIKQDVAVSYRPLVVQHNGVEVVRAYQNGSEVLVELGQGGTTAIKIPVGTDGQRPGTPAAGHLRINTTGANNVLEYWDPVAATWVQLTSGGGGGAPTTASYVLIANDATLSADRRLRAQAGVLALTDGGANGDVTIGVDAGGLPVANGGTGSTTAAGARTNLGLVIDTDVQRPSLTATQISIGGSDTITNSALATTFATTKSIPAGAANVSGALIRITARGTYNGQATSTTQKFDLMINGTSVAATGALTVAKSGTRGWVVQVDCIVTTTGASAQIDIQGFCQLGNAATSSLTSDMLNTSTKTVDLTASVTVAIQETMGAAVASWSVTQRHLTIEVLRLIP
jgi:hypothetical protein